MAHASLPVQFAEYVALRAVAALSHTFPTTPNFATATTVGRVFAWLGPKRVERAVGNIRGSFPEWSEARCREVAEASIRHMFQIFMVDSLALPRHIGPTNWLRHIDVGTIRDTLRLLLADRPAMFLSGHFGNWELLGYALATIGFPLHAVARPLDNRWINRWLLDMREARGMRILTKWGVMPEVQETIARGGRIAFVGDQNAGDDGIFVPFFGRLASSYKAISLLAIRYRVPIVVGCALRLRGQFRWSLEGTEIIEPEAWEAQPDPLFYATARYAHALEQMVRLAPEQYVWIHRRWKSRPRFEREGRPFPANLRAKLESLPWMTEESLQRVIANSSPA